MVGGIEVAVDPFELEKQAAGLKGDWQKDSDDYYRLDTAWWQSFSVWGYDAHWEVNQGDHDAGINDDGTTYSAWDKWDETFPSWIDAAKEIEKRYLKS